MHSFRFSPFAALAALLSFAPLISAQDASDLGTLVVSAAKHETTFRHVSTGATIISRQELIQRGYREVDEALRDITGFDIAQDGGPGGLSAPQLRGLPGRFMVVLIDGVRVNDPADANGGAGTIFSHLTTDMIERIEVVRGPQSPLYGSNAASGVINIITRSGSGKPHTGLAYEGGSLESQREAADLSGSRGRFDYRLSQDLAHTGGVIAKEFYRNYGAGAKIGYHATNGFGWESTFGLNHVRRNFAEFNENYDGAYGGQFWAVETPDPHQEIRLDYLNLGNRFTHPLSDNWTQELNVGYSRRARHTLDPNDGLLGYMSAPNDGFSLDFVNFFQKGAPVPVYDTPYGVQDYRYRGSNLDLDYRQTLLLSGAAASNILTGGVEYLFQGYVQSGTYGDLSDNLHTTGLYLNNQTLLAGDRLSLNSGLRYDRHAETRSSTTGMLGGAWDFSGPGLILRANVGSAFRAPAVYELFSTDNGNRGLKPETSRTVETGIEKYGRDGSYRLSVGWWRTGVEDAIVWVLTDPATYVGQYRNFDKARSQGIEAELKLRLRADWLASANYTYTDSHKYDRAAATWSRNIQIPWNKVNLNLTWLYRQGGSLSLDGYWVDGSRLRWNGIDHMSGYFKLDLTGRCPLGRMFTGTLSLRNILNRNYYEAMGYREPGFQAFAGLELSY